MTSELWPAPVAGAPVAATVRVPGSKSITNRALVIAAIADSPTTLLRPLRSRDTDLMVAGPGASLAEAADRFLAAVEQLPAGADVARNIR